MSHPRLRLDPMIHAPVRLSIMVALAAVDESAFASVRDALALSDSTVSKQVTILEGAGYIWVRKSFVGKRPRTYLALTAKGRSALAIHIRALRDLTDLSDQVPSG